jgi:hypothetical protein
MANSRRSRQGNAQIKRLLFHPVEHLQFADEFDPALGDPLNLRSERSVYFIAGGLSRAYRFAMEVVIHLTREEEAKALPILLRHSPGMVLPNRTYVLSEGALRALRRARIAFAEVSREAVGLGLEEAAGERV